MSADRISNLKSVSLLGMNKVESWARGGEECVKSAGGLLNNGTQVSGEKELRFEHEDEVCDMWAP